MDGIRQKNGLSQHERQCPERKLERRQVQGQLVQPR